MGKVKIFLRFLTEDIWRIEKSEVNKTRFSIYEVLKILYLCIKRYQTNRTSSRASALTYSSLIAAVPIAAILFAISRGFGLSGMVEDSLKNSIALPTDTVETLIQFANAYLQQTKNGLFLGVGLLALLWSVTLLTNNIELTFNYIWNIRRTRTLYRKVTDYFSMFLFLPLLIVVSSGLSIFMSQVLGDMEQFQLLAPVGRFFLRLVPYVLTWLMFTALYIFMPNTHVKFKPALISGILIGTTYQFFQFIYIGLQLYVSRYNAIYGSFAALPLFMIWLQLSWSIILFGVELTYAQQNIRNFAFDKDTRSISRRYKDFVTLLVLSLIVKRFQNKQTPYGAEEISEEYKIPLRLVKNVLYLLQEIELINEVYLDEKGNKVSYQPSFDINKLTISLMMDRINRFGSENFKLDTEKLYAKHWEALEEFKHCGDIKLSNRLVKDLF